MCVFQPNIFEIARFIVDIENISDNVPEIESAIEMP